MRFASLGSGSAGNALVAEAGGTAVLLDCGFGIRETTARLARLGLEASDLSGILLTHEHDDHAKGAFRLAAHYSLAVYLTHGTLTALGKVPAGLDLCIIDSHTPFAIGDLEIHPYPVPHDAREPVQFVFGDGAHRLGVLTDTGTGTPCIEAMLSACDALVIECNHDLDLLAKGDYPWPLKKRILGRLGHLDNACAASILSRLDNSRLQHIFAAHLSTQNNRPELARQALAGVLNCAADWIGIAEQDCGFDWRQIV
jgi:phosphoribosyl 1,2-cyclic phosphodiesterase